MYLSKLKIFGFKSFAQKAEVLFPGNGLTAVVGPNGCGKSNIVDAIRWVIGEQRASQLRMAKMQDIIFSGTEDRPAQNMAEVTLVINNDKGMLPSGFSEIQITRRAYRNGDTEYLINNQECRLKDIQNLFYDTGMGAASYSLMEQKMIDAILSDKAEERRVLFEEAAGVSKYKQQRKETVRQLEKVSADMERLEVNLQHVRQNVRQHEKQVARAAEWKKVRDRQRSLDLSMAVDRYSEERSHLDLFAQAKERLLREQSDLQTRLSLLETQLSEKRLAISGDEEEYRTLEQQVSKAQQEIQQLSGQATILRAQRQNHESNLKRFHDEIVQSESQLELLRQQHSEVSQQVMDLEGSQDDFAPEQERLEESCAVLRERWESLKEERRELTISEKQLREEVVRLRTRWERVDAELEQLAMQEQSQKSDQSRLQTELERLDSEVLPWTEELSLLKENAQTDLQRIESVKDSITDFRQKLQEAERAERSAESQRISLQSRRDALEHLRQSGAGIDGGARWVVENRSQMIRGLLADLIEVKSHTEWIEFCLGAALQTVIVHGETSVQSLINALDEAKAGRVGLAQLWHREPLAPIEYPQGQGIVGPARSFIQGEGLDSLLDWLLGKWVLVENFETALRLAQENSSRDLWFAAPHGRAVHTSGLIRGGVGKGTGAGLLSRKQEIETLDEQIVLVIQNVKNCQTELDQVKTQLSELELLRSNAETDLRERQRRERELESSLQVAQAKRNSCIDQIKRIVKTISQIQDRQTLVAQERIQDRQLIENEEKLRQVESELTRVVDACDEMESQARSAEEDLRDLQGRRKDADMNMQNGRRALQALQQQMAVHEGILASRNSEIVKSDLEIEKLSATIEQLDSLVESKNESLGEQEVLRDRAKEKYDTLVGSLEDWNDEIRSLNQQLRVKDGELHEAQRRSESLQHNCLRLKERIFEEWEFNLDEPVDFDRVEYDVKDSAQEIKELKEQQKKIGPVNASVMEDFEAEKQRLQEVETQFDDLNRARSSLERTIDKLDRIARDRFLETFRQIQRNFQDVFSSLMIGGEARLALQEGVDPLEAEIEVNARPTGKKMRGVRALSGGERALTATSLLFALYMVKPSPYCILDEVDGPLDDANIGRFVGLLRRFSRQTQFIIVTHNKRTMAACDMLYGVTQEIKGISRISSVQMEQASGFVK